MLGAIAVDDNGWAAPLKVFVTWPNGSTLAAAALVSRVLALRVLRLMGRATLPLCRRSLLAASERTFDAPDGSSRGSPDWLHKAASAAAAAAPGVADLFGGSAKSLRISAKRGTREFSTSYSSSCGACATSRSMSREGSRLDS
eukprot:scaffold78700_cov32-Tisochrysis_lutea.AAC.5